MFEFIIEVLLHISDYVYAQILKQKLSNWKGMQGRIRAAA